MVCSTSNSGIVREAKCFRYQKEAIASEIEREREGVAAKDRVSKVRVGW